MDPREALDCLNGVQEVAGSNPVAPTISLRYGIARFLNSASLGPDPSRQADSDFPNSAARNVGVKRSLKGIAERSHRGHGLLPAAAAGLALNPRHEVHLSQFLFFARHSTGISHSFLLIRAWMFVHRRFRRLMRR